MPTQETFYTQQTDASNTMFGVAMARLIEDRLERDAALRALVR